MAGGKFNQTATLNKTNYWVEWPEGPLFPQFSDRIDRVEVWLMQKSTGAIQMTYQTSGFGPNSWKANRIWWPRKQVASQWVWDGNGRFKPGPAMGSAVLVATSLFGLGKQSYFWWSEEVEIVP
jgi:hypothetical protein